MRKIGIVGGGITGVTCAHELQHAYDVTVFEREDQLGGHARTVRVGGVDTEAAVSVLGTLTYEEFFRLMGRIGFDSFEDDLSSVKSKGLSCDSCEVLVRINKQSPDIAGGVHVGKDEMDVGAGWSLRICSSFMFVVSTPKS